MARTTAPSAPEKKPAAKVQRRRRRPYEAPPPPSPPEEPAESTPAAAPEPPPAAPPESPAALQPAPAPAADPARERDARAERLVRRHAAVAAAIGLLPLPLIDMAALSAWQMKMLAGLFALYGRKYDAGRGRNLLAALAGGVVPVSAATGSLGYLLHLVPLVGPGLSLLALPGLAGAATLALGRLFSSHLSLGVDPLRLDPVLIRGRFQAELARVRAEGR